MPQPCFQEAITYTIGRSCRSSGIVDIPEENGASHGPGRENILLPSFVLNRKKLHNKETDRGREGTPEGGEKKRRWRWRWRRFIGPGTKGRMRIDRHDRPPSIGDAVSDSSVWLAVELNPSCLHPALAKLYCTTLDFIAYLTVRVLLKSTEDCLLIWLCVAYPLASVRTPFLTSLWVCI